MNYGLKEHVLVFVLVGLVFTFYMEMVYMPSFMPWMNQDDLSLLSYPVVYEDALRLRVINVGGILLFVLSLLGGRSLIHFLESLNSKSDRLGCISDLKGRFKEDEI